jgi:hypothetical protein
MSMRSKLTLSAFYLFAEVLDGEFQQTRTEQTGNVHDQGDQRQHLVESQSSMLAQMRKCEPGTNL